MQVSALVMWIDIAVDAGILCVAILALIKWSKYMDMRMQASVHGPGIVRASQKAMSLNERAVMSSQLAFDSILRKENALSIVEEEDDISAEEFYGAVNHKQRAP